MKFTAQIMASQPFPVSILYPLIFAATLISTFNSDLSASRSVDTFECSVVCQLLGEAHFLG